MSDKSKMGVKPTDIIKALLYLNHTVHKNLILVFKPTSKQRSMGNAINIWLQSA